MVRYPYRLLFSLALASGAAIAPDAAAESLPIAQAPPPQDIFRPDDTDIPEPDVRPTLPSPEDLLDPTPTTPTDPDAEAIPGTIVVDEFLFEGNTAFTAERLAEEVSSYVGREITFSELLQARSAITDLYVSSGFVTSGAFIPPQKLSEGKVIVRVVEGDLEEITISGTKHLNTSYVRGRLQRGTEAPLNQDLLLESLQLLLLDPLIENISAELSAGSRAGRSILTVTVEEASPWRSEIELNNGRSPSVGAFRRQARLTNANLIGFGDGLTLGYTNTDGSNEFEVGYTVPVNAKNGTVSLRASFSESEIVEEPFDQVDIEATSQNYELSYRQPLVRTPTREFALGLSLGREQSNTFLLGASTPLSEGADERGRTRLSTLRFFQEWVSRGSQSVFAARSQFNFGFDAFEATDNDADIPDSEFFSWRGQLQWLRLLAEDTLLLLRSDIQLTPDELLALEQFGVGGFESVRGYRQDTLLTDNGLLISGEVRLPIARVKKVDGVFQVVPFFDLGLGWNVNDVALNPNTLAGIGIGLRWQLGDYFTARLDYGLPLIDENDDTDEETLQEEGFYFSVIWNPF